MQVLEPFIVFHYASLRCCTTVIWHIMSQYSAVQQVSHTSGRTSSGTLPVTVPPPFFNAVRVTHPVGYAAAATSGAWSHVSSRQVQSATCWGRRRNASIDEEGRKQRSCDVAWWRISQMQDSTSIWAKSPFQKWFRTLKEPKTFGWNNLFRCKNLDFFF